MLTRYAMKNDTYRQISGTEVHRAPNPNEKWDRVWKNKNRLLTGLYEYSTGGKTGYTKLAKRTLVSTATKGDMNLIAVTLNAPSDWNDHIHMFESAFKQFDMVQVIDGGMIKNVDEKFYKKQIYFGHEFTYPVTEEERELFKIDIKLLSPKEEWKEQRNVPEVVGKAIIYFDEKPLKEMPVYYKRKEEQNESFLDRFKSLFTTIIGVRANG